MKRTTTKVLLCLAIPAIAICTLLSACGQANNGSGVNDAAEAAAPRPYNMAQKIFCLNVLSNISARYNNQTASIINDSTRYAVNAVLNDGTVTSIIGNWKCVWGPVVVAAKPNKSGESKALNTMYIAQNVDSPAFYVVAIAGTNSTSITDWITEDFDVLTTKKWPYVPTKSWWLLDVPRISSATYNGLTALQGMQDAALNNISAYTFLKQQAQNLGAGKPMTVWVTGHSLGGALSPTYGLYLYSTKDTGWGANAANVSINVLAAAGATPGNDTFSNLYTACLGNNTIRVWNTEDVVPHGFQPNMMNEISTIYATDSPAIPTPLWLDSTIKSVVKLTSIDNYTQLIPQNTGFTSGYYKLSDTMTGNKMNPDTSFATQVLCQHVPAYAAYFGMGTFQSAAQAVLKLQFPLFSQGFYPAPIVDSGSYPVLPR